MNIKLNGENKTIENNINLLGFVEAELNSKEPRGVAVALNGKVIPKQKWDSVTVNENDEIEIVHAVQGG
jgi:sulfur carrier protein